ncbi:MAG: hypothetical protein KAG14_01885, partial [Mycoplasmataceae bacterium]|nr:hypothetical protein [Mycoplasmataceae bacterium]
PAKQPPNQQLPNHQLPPTIIQSHQQPNLQLPKHLPNQPQPQQQPTQQLPQPQTQQPNHQSAQQPPNPQPAQQHTTSSNHEPIAVTYKPITSKDVGTKIQGAVAHLLEKGISQEKVREIIEKTGQTLSAAGLTSSTLGQKTIYSLPDFINISGPEHDAKILPFSISNSNTTVEYSMNGNEINDLNHVDMVNGDDILAKVMLNNTIVFAKKYTIFSLTSQQLPVEKFNDGGFANKLVNNTLSLQDIFSIMNNLEEGKSYKNYLANGTKATLMPNATRIAEGIMDAPDHFMDHSYSPFLDISMGADYLAKGDHFDEFVQNYSGVGQNINIAFGNQMIINRDGEDVNGIGFNGAGLTGTLYDDGAVDKTGGQNIDIIMKNMFNKFRERGSDVIPSLGGATGTMPQENSDIILLARQLELFCKAYKLTRLDYDIEGGAANSPWILNLAAASALVQKKMESEGKHLYIDLTLASEFDGLASYGIDTLNTFISSGVEISMLKGMTMMMNPKEVAKRGPVDSQIFAATSLRDQLIHAYSVAGVTLPANEAIKRIGVIWDISGDTWSAEDLSEPQLEELKQKLVQLGVGMISHWSANNDIHGMNSGGTNHVAGGQNGTLRNVFHDSFTSVEHTLGKPKIITNSDNNLISILNKYYMGGSDLSASALADPNDGKPLKKGDKFQYISPIDGLLHIWMANWWASSNQRPGKHGWVPGQFEDLGIAESDTSKFFKAIKQTIVQEGWSVFGRLGHGGPIANIVKSTAGTSMAVRQYNPILVYRKGQIVIYEEQLYICNTYADPNKAPTAGETGKYKTWHHYPFMG